MSIALSDARPAVDAALNDYHDRFAAAYDTFYRHRDVDGEVECACALLELNDRASTPRVLDFGCGTGSHVVALARRGYDVVGLDTSPAMIDQARAKASSLDTGSATFLCAASKRMPDSSLIRNVDGVVSFFNVLNCMNSAEAMLESLSIMRDSLRIGAKAYIEVWNGAAVFCDQPRPDVRHFQSEGPESREMIRITIPEVDRIHQRCTLRYRVLELDKSLGNYTEFESVHRLHFLTPVQYRHLFALAGLDLVDEFPKGRPGSPVGENDWYMAYLLRR